MCGWIKPHPPWNIPDEWAGHYDDVELPEPIPPSRGAPYYAESSPWFGDEMPSERKLAMRRAYYTCVSMIDHAVGRILDYLGRNGLLDNTFILYTSDHGEMLQDKGLYQKMAPYESSAHIPFVVRYPPAFAPGSEEERFVDLMDILPTFLDVASIDLTAKPSRAGQRMPGSSLLRLGDRASESTRDRSLQRSAYGIEGGRWVMLRDRRYKYVHFYGGGIEQFYDLQRDPQEEHDLVAADALPREAFERLRTRCIELERKWGPEGHVRDGDFARYERRERSSPRGQGLYPGWANRQMPVFGDLTPEEEAALLVDQTRRALGERYSPEYLRSLAPEPWWIEHWWQEFGEHGGSEAQRDELFGRDES
jgi:arylsulfatase A-like enzyme